MADGQVSASPAEPLEGRSHGDQNGVSTAVTVAIVVALEFVDIANDQRRRAICSRCAAELRIDAGSKVSPNICAIPRFVVADGGERWAVLMIDHRPHAPLVLFPQDREQH